MAGLCYLFVLHDTIWRLLRKRAHLLLSRLAYKSCLILHSFYIPKNEENYQIPNIHGYSVVVYAFNLCGRVPTTL